MLRKITLTAISVSGTFLLHAQDSTAPAPKPLLSGYVDVYFRHNLSEPTKASGLFNNFTSFTNSHNSFDLNTVSVKLEHSFGKVGVVADIGFGKRAEEFSYTDGDLDQNKNGFLTMAAIKQAYLTYSPTANLKFTAGSWATHIGYEVVDPYLNRNYSMSYMFSYGPFFHTGVKADYTAGKSGFMLGIANPTDLKSASFAPKTLIAQYSFAPTDNFKAYVNYQGGKASANAKLQQIDVVLTDAISDKFTIGYNGTIFGGKTTDSLGKFGDSHSWWGSALYLNVDPQPWFGLTLRGEYFDNKKAVSAAPEASMFATTLSANFKINGLTFIPEIRHEVANKGVFTDHSGELTKNSTSLLLAAVYKF
jgi:hypothetical protein